MVLIKLSLSHLFIDGCKRESYFLSLSILCEKSFILFSLLFVSGGIKEGLFFHTVVDGGEKVIIFFVTLLFFIVKRI